MLPGVRALPPGLAGLSRWLERDGEGDGHSNVASRCSRLALGFPLLFGWACCPGVVEGVADVVARRLPAHPAQFLLGLGAHHSVSFEEYRQLVAEERRPPKYSGKFRAIDGQGNNAENPWLGQGRRPYSIQSCKHTEGAAPEDVQLPSVTQPIQELWGRDTFEAAPNKTNALTVWLALFLSHDMQRTHDGLDPADGPAEPWINLHSSYLDLQTLYGYRQDIAASIRELEGGRLKQDAYAETRFGKFPVCAALATLLSREHNHVAAQLALQYPDKFTSDEELFQQARLIMGGVYVNIMARDFACGLTGTTPSKGCPLPLLAAATGPHHTSPAGCHSSWEVNFAYRIHETIPSYYNIEHARAGREKTIEEVIGHAMATSSGRFGPCHCPIAQIPEAQLGAVEAKAIRLGRTLGLPTFNDFREMLGFPRYKTFEEAFQGASQDPLQARVVPILKQMYGCMDNVELYIGLRMESPGTDGWGAPPTTLTVMLTDLVSRIRNDRFYTTDFTEEVYTAWGLAHAHSTSLAHIINRHTELHVPEHLALTRLLEDPPQRSRYSLRGMRSHHARP